MPISPSLSASRARRDAGWFFAASFRPFFLGASLYAAMAIPVWVAAYFLGRGEVFYMPALHWHVHEMVFGYMPAVMAGYLLSATPNWTGRLPASGWPLAALFSIWVGGRLVPLAASLPIATLVDAAFPGAMTLVLAREARADETGRSRHGLMLFPLIAAGSVLHRLYAADYEIASLVARSGVAIGILMIAAVGGRLVPSFTRNALAKEDGTRVPEPYGRFDVIVLIASFAALAVWAVAPGSVVSGPCLAVCSGLHLVRLARWRGWRLRSAEILMLHAGYLWLVAGTLLGALSSAPFHLVSPDATLHAFGAGAIGVMTMAVMARLSASRGAGARTDMRLALTALGLVNAGAALRVAAALTGESFTQLLLAGAVLWSLGFAVFAMAQFLRAVVRPRDVMRG